jgi:DNA-binding PadR family transcriptional regulator
MAASLPTYTEITQLLGMLQNRGLIEVCVHNEGRKAYRSTDDGARVGHLLPMRGAAHAALAGLLG